MRTSLNETKQIEEHLLNRGTVGDALVFDAMLILDPDLPYRVLWQKSTYNLVQQYGRKKLRAEIEAVHQQLFHDPAHQSFAQKLLRLFYNR